VGERRSTWNFGRWNSLSTRASGDVGREKLVTEKSVLEKFEDIGLGAGGQSVMSVLSVTEWNLAYDIMVEALLGPECRRTSGLPVLVSVIGSFWMVMWKRCGGAGRGLRSFGEGAGEDGLRRISLFDRKNVISRGNRG
jgi:hypothetical protein